MKTKKIVLAAVLTALGIVIPMFMPRLPVPPAFGSYTLASHVPVMLAMFVSPMTALFVGLGTAAGFFVTMPFVVGVRALTHVLWAVPGALYIKARPDAINKPVKLLILGVALAVPHALAEVLAVLALTSTFDAAKAVMLTYGLGFFLHSLIDYAIALAVAVPLKKGRLL